MKKKAYNPLGPAETKIALEQCKIHGEFATAELIARVIRARLRNKLHVESRVQDWLSRRTS